MASSASSSGDDVVSEINVTPLVDITLVLLIVFIVTARIIAGQTLPIDLPKASTGSEQQVVLAIEVSASGAVAVDGRSVEGADAVEALARDALARSPELRAVIDADTHVEHGKVVEVIDRTKRAGVTRIAFGVAPGR